MARKKGIISSVLKKFQTALLPPVAALILWVIYKTIRWKINEFGALNDKRPFIAAFWHGKQLMLAPLSSNHLPRFCTSILISAHTDGRIIANAIRWFGLGSVSGSSTRGGVTAYRSLLEHLESGMSVGITPDGPRGPCYKVKDGVIKLAQMSGIPITPVSCTASRVWQFRSWDKMILPKPFSEGICVLGEPYFVPADADEAACGVELENRLNQLGEKAEALLKQ